MPDLKNQWFQKRILYNFALHGGAIGNIVLDTLPDGLVIQGVTVNTVTGITSAGGATVSFGNQTTNTAYIAAQAKTTLDTVDKLVSTGYLTSPVKIRSNSRCAREPSTNSWGRSA